MNDDYVRYYKAVPVGEVLKSVRTDWKSLPEWIIKLYESGKIIFGNNFVRYMDDRTTFDCLYGEWIVLDISADIVERWGTENFSHSFTKIDD